jgi:hypothetical protein
MNRFKKIRCYWRNSLKRSRRSMFLGIEIGIAIGRIILILYEELLKEEGK